MSHFKKKFSKCYEKVTCIICAFIATPVIFFVEMFIVRPKIIQLYHLGVTQQYLHIICATFCFINVTGNMFMSIFTDTSLKRSSKEGTYCEPCKLYRPAGSWHCNSCNACIVRRDHHCTFFSRCIGLHNQRYYVSYLGYIAISLAYSFNYNYYYVASLFEDYGLFFSTLRILNPMLRYLGPEPMGFKDVCSLLLMMNFILLIWCFSLFLYHVCNMFKGVTSRERKTVCLFGLERSKWKENMVQVYGQRWLLAMVCPFVYSSLPGSVKVE